MTAIESAVDDDAFGSPIRSLSRNRRGAMPEKGLDENWLAQQLKRTRDQLDKKSTFCDELATELRKLEADLHDRDRTIVEVKGQLRAANAEIKASTPATGPSLKGSEVEPGHAEAEVSQALPTVEDGSLERVQEAARAAEARAVQLEKENEELKEAVLRERELHDEAMRLLKAVRSRNDEDVIELQQELQDVASGLEQKEEEILSIQFDMVNLQSNLAEQVELVSANAEAFKQASEELAEKDERLGQALEKEKELLAQISSLQELQEKVSKLSSELDGSRAANKALEEQMNAKINDLQADRDGLAAELARLRCEGSAPAAGRGNQAPKGEEADQTKKTSTSASSGARQEHAHDDPEGSASEQLTHYEARINELTRALERSRLLERQALERAQEYRTSLALYREFGQEGFLHAAPRASDDGAVATGNRQGMSLSMQANFSCQEEGGSPGSATARRAGGGGSPSTLDDEDGDSPTAEVDLPSTLIAINLDLGVGRMAVLRIAPWHTRSDFEQVVSAFLTEHKVKPVFAQPLIRYLEQVEEEAESFPLTVQADLSVLYSQYG